MIKANVRILPDASRYSIHSIFSGLILAMLQFLPRVSIVVYSKAMTSGRWSPNAC